MKKGFYWIMAAQFFSSLADNALLIASIALLVQLQAPGWMTPLLKFFFTVSYVVLAPFVGAFADSLQKGRVMFITNIIKMFGLLLMLASVHPLLAYGVVGLGAAAYSPAKYGILTELLPPQQLVAANGWIEGTTVGSIILGTVLGGFLVSELAGRYLVNLSWLHWFGITTVPETALAVIVLVYLVAALCNLKIPDTGARYPHQTANPLKQLPEFIQCTKVLWTDKLGQISMAVTTLFWGAGATLQFIVIKWAEHALGLDLSKAATLQATVAFGVAAGAALAASRVPLKKSLTVLPVGMGMGILCMVLSLYSRDLVPDVQFSIGHFHVPLYLLLAGVFMVSIGAMAGYFVVPMNALLQHRGYVLLSAGHSIAVQNFNENVSVLVMLLMYAMLIRLDLPIQWIIGLFGAFVLGTMWLVMRWNARNMRQRDWTQLIGESRHESAP
ncbi:MAG: lysophospholipid transporter LplT [Betaproteobacteria bacterium]|jgi:MFS family permease|uniref:Putative Permease of the major facilitator superfamily n=1 Tax=Thiomonas delicata TaxID=364030 RepID=A0A238D438_THIDL|nr:MULTISPECIES: lysophospholipid transporter LplT [Thiomonas]MDE2130938.1 lysophospholipid transporter LplT [Betaproteobacteria bacterium]OZB45273.1 MAG: lysophospholipid transporter LplT [Thiomonas sp. 15-66-11]OZB60588.1 MAG: lysophospholipid transporter LplT [Thiomonas sp. 13-66-29]SBP88078.1 putative Permease of the major facilitator superfamily [Thiomonas delicata]